jgi:serine/threonine protein kinase
LKVKLCDFGFAEELRNKVQKSKGTDGYRAPETYDCDVTGGFDGAKADMFALGVMLFIMEFGASPFSAATKDNQYYRYLYREPNMQKMFFRMHPSTKEQQMKGSLNNDLVDLLLALFNENPEKRPKTIADIR